MLTKSDIITKGINYDELKKPHSIRELQDALGNDWNCEGIRLFWEGKPTWN